jgi:hypothetical protein
MRASAIKPARLTKKEEEWLHRRVFWHVTAGVDWRERREGIVCAVVGIPSSSTGTGKPLTMLRVLRDDNGKLLQEPEARFQRAEEEE